MPYSNEFIQTMMESWISCHNHTHYSKLDGMCDIDKLVQLAKSYGMKALAITDHGIMSGIVKFFNSCTKHGIKPIIGIEIYLTEDSTLKSKEAMKDKGYGVYHLILYAKNQKGLENLYKLASYAGNEGLFDDYERIDLDYVVKNNLGEGIICTSACLGGPMSRSISAGPANYHKSIEWAIKLNGTFENFYIELGFNSMPDQAIVNNVLMSQADSLSIPIILSGDTHYLYKQDAEQHDMLLAINTGSMVDDPDRKLKMLTDDYYLRLPREAYDFCVANNIPLEAIENTNKIADMCDVDIRPKNSKALLPPFIVPKGYTEDSYLYKLCYDNLIELAKKKQIDYIEYANRLSYELDIISSKGYSGYFLILWDIINFCVSKNIMTGPGRGSAAGALTSYLLSITKLDPIKHGFFFERFLDPEKNAFPDCIYSRAA